MFCVRVTTSLECDVCGRKVEPDDKGRIPKGWRIQTFGWIFDGAWPNLSERGDLIPGDDGLSFMAVCPDCDPADTEDYNPADWKADEE